MMKRKISVLLTSVAIAALAQAQDDTPPRKRLLRHLPTALP